MGRHSKTARPPGRRLIRKLARFLGGLIVTLIAGLAITWFAFRDTILGKALETVDLKLSRAGLYLNIDSHHLSWTGAAILEGVELFSDEAKQDRIATMDSLEIRIPLADLIRGESRLVASTRNSELGLETTAGALLMEEMGFKLEVDAQSLVINHFESRFQGLRVTIDGGLQWPTQETGVSPETDAPGGPKKFSIPDLSPAVKVASWLEFPEGDPTLALSLRSAATPDGGHEMDMLLTGENFRWKTLPLEKARIPVSLKPGAVVLNPMSLDGFGGHLEGGLTIDYGNREIRIDELDSTMDPFRFIEALPLADSVGASMKRFQSLGSTSVSTKRAVFKLSDFSASSGTFSLTSSDGIRMKLPNGDLDLSMLKATATLSKGMLAIDASRFSAFGGSGSGGIQIPTSGDFHYQANISGKGFSAAALGKVIGEKEELPGTIRLNYSGRGASGPRSHAGKGRVDVTGGNFYSIPVFGGLRSFPRIQLQGLWETMSPALWAWTSH